MHQRRILIVDDDAMILRLLQISIDRLFPECQIVAAVNGTAALAKLRQQPFDLILTDYDMPGMNGLDLAQGTLIPSGAVQILEGKSYVYVVGGTEQETKAERKEVAVLAETGGTMAISGIESGDQVIYPVPTTLRPDTTIKVIETATSSEPPSAQETE